MTESRATKGPYSKPRARRAAFHAILFRIPAQLASLFGYVLLVRLLSESDFGIYNLFYAVLPLISAAASLGLEHTLRRYQPEYLKNHENRLADLLVRRIGLLRFAANAALLIVIVALWPSIAPLFKIADYREYFFLFGFLILTHFQCRVLTVALSSHLLQKYSVGAFAAFSVAKLVGYSVAASTLGFSLWTAFWADLAGYLLFYGILKYFYHTRPDRHSGDAQSLSASERWRLIKYGAFYNFNDAGTLPMRARTDNFFIAAFIDPIAVGAYAFCTRLNEMVNRSTPLRQLESVIQPMFFSLDHQNDAKRVRTYFSLLLTLALVVRIPVLFFIACYHRELVQIVFGGKFLEYSHLLVVVFLFSTANAIDAPVTLVAQLKEKAHIIFASRIFGIYNIVALILLIPQLGVLGAMLASGSAALMKNSFIWWFVRDLAKWKDYLPFLARSGLVWSSFAGLSYLFQQALQDQALTALSLGLILWCGFFIVYLRIGALTEKQRELIAGLFHGREVRVLRLLGFAT